MMVIFVSQCEKNALAKTRRVLDAFANRIGDNTWQTVITNEGLQAVRKLLRKTASKSTAVSCHWIRSRSRSDLLWVVGNRNKFNEQGIVPVNYTEKDVLMDVITMKAKQSESYANTQLQPLAEHLFAVGHLARVLFELVVDNDDYANLANAVFISGVLHDIGKLDPRFQEWVRKGKRKGPDEDGQHIDSTKFSFEKHPRHNEISLFLFNFFERQCTALNNISKSSIQHVLYWHHAKPYRKNDQFTGVAKVFEYLKKNLAKDELLSLLKNTPKLIRRVANIAHNYDENSAVFLKKIDWHVDDVNSLIDDFSYAYKASIFPAFKEYESTDDFNRLHKKIALNAHNNLLRSCVISADRIISSLTAQDLMSYISEQRLGELIDNQQDLVSNLSNQIVESLSIFPASERTSKQTEVAKALSQIRDIAILSGAAGCGKTKVALEWAMLGQTQKLLWICPRVQVCQGIFEELTQQYLPDTNIEIYTGEFKFTNVWDNPTGEDEYFSGDIVVTTIDQVLNSITTHTKVDGLIPYMQAHVVFDEYHEYINMEVFNLLFAELVVCKAMLPSRNKKTLLVSATPHYAYLKNVLVVKAEHDVAEMPSFNKSRYKINFVEYDENVKEGNPFYQAYDGNTFIISNTAKQAQCGFLYQKENENAVLFHSKLKRNDKKQWFSEVYESFKKEGTKQFSVLRSGPVVQASLNISSDAMLSEMSSAENILQRLGRLDRFGTNKNLNVLTIAITESVKASKQTGASAKFLAKLHSLRSAKAWHDFLEEKLNGKEFILAELYILYKEFNEWAAQDIEQDLEQAIKASIMLLDKKVTEPTKIVQLKTKEKKQKISKNSLRGDSRFVQMALLDVNDYKHPVFMNEYAYQQPLKEGEAFNNLTESLSLIRDTGLLQFIAQKHSNIDVTHPIKGIPANKMIARNAVLENYSRDAEYPLYLSYTEEDLNSVGGVSVRHPEAIYYAVCDKQPIGSISIKTINDLNT